MSFMNVVSRSMSCLQRALLRHTSITSLVNTADACLVWSRSSALPIYSGFRYICTKTRFFVKHIEEFGFRFCLYEVYRKYGLRSFAPAPCGVNPHSHKCNEIRLIGSGLVGSTNFHSSEGCCKSQNCSRDTYSESYITKYTRIQR